MFADEQHRDSSAAVAGGPGADLLPLPRRVRKRSGFFHLADGMPIGCAGAREPPEAAALERFRDLCAERVGVRLAGREPEAEQGAAGIVAAVASEGQRPTGVPGLPTATSQAYGLRITPKRVEIIGRSPTGTFYGLQTLRQILLRYGRRWPCLEVEDAPDFAVRGFSCDVSRGRVPTLETLKRLVDRLATLKVNHLQLYVEHTFAFRFNPNIGRDCSPLTADEIRALDAYCELHRVELVPSLASCGHMGRVLSLPEYRHLAEVETTRSWSETTWTERMRGLTLDVTNPQARELLEKMYAELLPLFSSRLMNVCCDETYDLGQGKNRRRAAELGVGELYLEHLGFLDRLCRRHGKRLMFWSDVIRKYPALLSRIPRGAIVLDWHYTPDADFGSTATFRDAGLTTFVCPGTSAWNRPLSNINAAELNIRHAAAAGRQHGAAGLLNTDWGDEGHVNPPAASWHPIALGAALAWNSAGPPARAFDRAFSRLVFGDADTAITETLRAVAAASDLPRSWPAFCAPLIESVPEEAVSRGKLARWRSLSAQAAEMLSRLVPQDEEGRTDIRELALACRLNALVAERLDISRRLVSLGGVPDEALAGRLADLADACERFRPDYEAAWLAGNKPSGLHEVTAVFERLDREARMLARQRSKT